MSANMSSSRTPNDGSSDDELEVSHFSPVDVSDRLRSWDGPNNRDALLSDLRDLVAAVRLQAGDTLVVGIKRQLSMAERDHYQSAWAEMTGRTDIHMIVVDDCAGMVVHPGA